LNEEMGFTILFNISKKIKKLGTVEIMKGNKKALITSKE